MGQYHLIGGKACGSAIAEALLNWAQIPFEYTELSWEDREKWPAVIGPFNPLNQVPTLILPNGEVLTETLAIAVHADFIEPGIVPGGSVSDRFWRWAVFLVANIYPTFTWADNAEVWVKSPGGAQEVKDKSMELRKKYWKVLEDACTETPYFLGEDFCAIDIYLGVMTRWTPRLEWFEKECPKIAAIARNAVQHPCLQDVMQRHYGN